MPARKLYSGSLAWIGAGVARLKLLPGAWRRTVDAAGDVLSEFYEPQARCWRNQGDRLVLVGAAIEDIASVVIRQVEPDGAYVVQVAAGALPESTTTVRVLEARRAKVKRAARPVLTGPVTLLNLPKQHRKPRRTAWTVAP